MNRTLCAVLDEMRSCYETRNFSYLQGLVGEAQAMANRMESALWDQKDFEAREKRHRELKAEIEKLKEEKQQLTGKKCSEYEE